MPPAVDAVVADRHEAGGAKDGEVVVQARSLDGEAMRDLDGGQLAAGEDVEDAQPQLVTESAASFTCG